MELLSMPRSVVNIADVYGTTALKRSTPKVHKLELIKLLLQSHWEDRPLYEVVASGNAKRVRTLLNSGLNVNFRIERNNTLFKMAVESGNLAMAILLLDAGTDISLHFDRDKTALQVAVRPGDLAMVHVLLEVA
jgi:hypothetical protein